MKVTYGYIEKRKKLLKLPEFSAFLDRQAKGLNDIVVIRTVNLRCNQGLT